MTALPDLSEYFLIKDGFCRPDWRAIEACVASNVPKSEWKVAWKIIARRWVNQLCREFGSNYRVFETQNFLLLTDASDRIAGDVSKWCEQVLKMILSNFRGIAWEDVFGHRVVLMLPTVEEYYRYIHYYYPDGEHPGSGGVCLYGDGYVHIAFPTTGHYAYRSTLAHELTHCCLSNRRLPSWISEALAMRMEMAAGVGSFILDYDLCEQHFAHWNADSIQDFWSGKSWRIPGQSFKLSYSLAQILWRKIEVDIGASHEAVLRFIAAVEVRDGGEAACQSILGVSLGDLVRDFLGEGQWKPISKTTSKNEH